MASESVRAFAHIVARRRRPPSSPPVRQRNEAADPHRAATIGRWALAAAVAATSRASGHIVAAAAHRDLESGRPIIFVNVVEYDLVAHLTGPRSPRAYDALASIDALVGTLVRAAREAPRSYRVVVISDHGIAAASPISTAFAPDMRTWVTNEWARRTRSTHRHQLAVFARGSLLQAWVRDTGERQGLNTIASRAPGFVEAISRHPAIALTIAAESTRRDEGSGYLVVGRDGGVRLATRHRLPPGSEGTRQPPVVVERWGSSPFASLGRANEVEAHVAAFAERQDIGDIACLAAPTCGLSETQGDAEFWAFESQYGAHGGIGGDQGRPFVLIPPDDSGPPDGHGGAPSIHKWLESLAPPR